MDWYDYEMQDKFCRDSLRPYGYYSYGRPIGFINLNGRPIERTPFSHPYNYDEYVCWIDESFNRDKCEAVYSDRLYQWDYEKYHKCCKEVFKNQAQYFDKRNPEEIEEFLSMYFEKNIKLTAVVQGCNQATGYPYWVFFYEE